MRGTTEMALTAEQHSEIASAYESAAADSLVPPEHRAAFARKAELFRLLAKLAAKRNASPSPTKAADPHHGIIEAFSKARSRRKAPAEPETPAHELALMHLGLRWRLFQLETKTFGPGAALPAQPVRSTLPKH